MRVVVQRCKDAKVTVDETVTGAIGNGTDAACRRYP